jgi:plasmid stabilization system protein ParE
MARKVRITKRADNKLDNILIHLNKEFGVTTVDRFLMRLYSFFDVIIEFPQIGTINDKEKGIYGFVLEKQVTVFYRFTEKEVVIINFFETRKDPRNKLK